MGRVIKRVGGGECPVNMSALRLLATWGLAVVMSGGCATLRVTNPEKTATEQFLLSEAAIEAVKPLSFDMLHGRRVYLDDKYFAAAEREFVLGELRAKLLLSGVQVSPERASSSGGPCGVTRSRPIRPSARMSFRPLERQPLERRRRPAHPYQVSSHPNWR